MSQLDVAEIELKAVSNVCVCEKSVRAVPAVLWHHWVPISLSSSFSWNMAAMLERFGSNWWLAYFSTLCNTWAVRILGFGVGHLGISQFLPGICLILGVAIMPIVSGIAVALTAFDLPGKKCMTFGTEHVAGLRRFCTEWFEDLFAVWWFQMFILFFNHTRDDWFKLPFGYLT